jgi:hypothetical protein
MVEDIKMKEAVEAAEGDFEDVLEEAPQLSLEDLNVCFNLIDLGTERGAWRGPELATIAIVRGKLEVFLNAARPPESVPEDAPE